jgi:hypothetical protein
MVDRSLTAPTKKEFIDSRHGPALIRTLLTHADAAADRMRARMNHLDSLAYLAYLRRQPQNTGPERYECEKAYRMWRGVAENLDGALRDALPELFEYENTCAMWQSAADTVQKLRTLLSECEPVPRPTQPDTLLTSRNVLREIAATLMAKKPIGSQEHALGYRAGMKAAAHRLTTYADSASTDGSEHLDRSATNEVGLPPAPVRYTHRAMPPQDTTDLPDEDDYHSRLTDVLSTLLDGPTTQTRTELARQLTRKLGQPPQPGQLLIARTQWALHEKAIAELVEHIHTRTGLTVMEAHSRAFIARQLDRHADQLTPDGSISSAGFPSGFTTASRIAASILRTHADQIRPPPTHPVWQL